MANPQQLNHPIIMMKRGLSPEETKEIVSSKAVQIFDVLILEGQGADLNQIRNKGEVVSRYISYSITAEGYMDQRRCSPSFWQDLDIIPAPIGNDNGRHPGPQKVIDEINRFPGYLLYLGRMKRDSQRDLFDMLRLEMWNLLDEAIVVGNNGFLAINGRQLSAVEVGKHAHSRHY